MPTDEDKNHSCVSKRILIPNETSETKERMIFNSLIDVSNISVLAYCLITFLCLLATVIFINVNQKIISNDAILAGNSCGSTGTASLVVNHGREVLIGVSIACIVIYIIFSVFMVFCLQRISINIEEKMCQIYFAFDNLSKLHVENVPLYVNTYSDVDKLTERHTFILQCYSNLEEFQKTEDSMNNLSLVVRQFRKFLPDGVFHKKPIPDVRESRKGDTVILKTSGSHGINCVGASVPWRGGGSSVRRPNLASHLTSSECSTTHHSENIRVHVSTPREGAIRYQENDCSYRTLNLCEVQNEDECRLRRIKATVVVTHLSGLAAYIDEYLQLCYELSQEFLSVVTDLVDKYDGTVLCAVPDRVVAVWNAFSNTPDHEKNAMQYACEIILTLETFLTGVIVPMALQVTPVVVASSGPVVAGTVGAEEERAMVVYGPCVFLVDELPTWMIAQGIRYACTESLSSYCVNTFNAVPVDYVTDVDNNRHVICEIVEGSASSLQKIRDAFENFKSGKYNIAGHMYLDISRDNCENHWALRMSQLCSYLEKSGAVYQRQAPQWQTFETGKLDSNTWESKTPYQWMKPVPTSVEDEVRKAILKRSGTRPNCSTSSFRDNHIQPNSSTNDGAHLAANPLVTEVEEAKKHNITILRDPQGMTFRMSKRVLGTGANGSVCLGLSQTGALVAIKSIQLPIIRPFQAKEMSAVNRRRLRRKNINVGLNIKEAVDNIVNEVSLLSRLRHANIVGYISCTVLENKLLVVMEFASGGSLFNMLNKFTTIKVSRAKRYLRDALKGLVYLHRKNIVHRDIKPQNVLLLETGLCKLSDFGTSQTLLKISSTGQPEGTPPYISPEAARGKAEKASDIWSFGIMMAQILSGSFPWPNMNEMLPQAFCYNVGHNENFVPQVDDRISVDAREIIMWCCNRNPSKRPTAQELLSRPYFAQTIRFSSSHALNLRARRSDEYLRHSSLNGSQLKPGSGRFSSSPL